VILGSAKARTIALVKAHRHVGGAKGRRRNIPRQRYPLAIEAAMARAIAAMFSRATVRAAYQPLLDQLPQIFAEARAFERRDADPRKKVRDFSAKVRREFHQRVTRDAVASMSRQFATQVSAYNRAQLDRQSRAALGTEVAFSDSKLEARVEAWVEANVARITDITDEMSRRVERVIIAAVGAGAAAEALLGERLDKEFGFGERRAELIAQDQLGSLYGQFNRDRQRSVGVRSYIWRTMGDDRVRDEHEAIEGEEFTWDEGHPVEGHPGEPIACRCTAEPVYEEIQDDLDEEEEEADE
jgi:SPP1 gp7 family putative phage head morphogenesis protein